MISLRIELEKNRRIYIQAIPLMMISHQCFWRLSRRGRRVALHAGCAPGVDRIVMLLADVPNIREIIPFPMNQKAQDLMMDAPSKVSQKQLKELHLKTTKR